MSAALPLRRAEVFGELARLAEAGERFDIVIADPPAFVKSRKDLGPAACAAIASSRGWRRRWSRPAASCSSRRARTMSTADDFAEAVRRGLADAGRSGRILRDSGAAPDHPVHPALPESAYLKALTLALD